MRSACHCCRCWSKPRRSASSSARWAFRHSPWVVTCDAFSFRCASHCRRSSAKRVFRASMSASRAVELHCLFVRLPLGFGRVRPATAAAVGRAPGVLLRCRPVGHGSVRPGRQAMPRIVAGRPPAHPAAAVPLPGLAARARWGSRSRRPNRGGGSASGWWLDAVPLPTRHDFQFDGADAQPVARAKARRRRTTDR